MFVVSDSGTELLHYIGKEKHVTVPKTITAIGDSVFSGLGIESVSLPDTVTSIGKNAFRGCSLQKIILPDSVSSLGDSAFQGCRYLEYAEMGAVQKIGQLVFADCTSLARVVFRSAPEVLSERMFCRCTSLEKFSIPEGTKTLGLSCFESCSALRRISIPASVQNIGGGAFSHCIRLTDFDVDPSSPWYRVRGSELIRSRGYSLCAAPALTGEYVLPPDVSEVGSSALAGSEITRLELHENVCILSVSACSDCWQLEEVVFRGSTEILSFAFYKCRNLRRVVLPAGLKCIPMYLLNGCSSLCEVQIPDTVTSIGEYAFCNCSSLRSLILPAGITEIFPQAFGGMGSLERLTVLGRSTPLTAEVLNEHVRGCYGNALAVDFRDRPLSMVPPELRDCALRGFALARHEGVQFSREDISDWLTHIREHKRELRDVPHMLELMIREGLLEAEDMDWALDTAESMESPELKALLLQYRHGHFSRKDMEAVEAERYRDAMLGS